MIFKVIQVNIYKGQYLDELLSFFKKENPDFICAQEVTFGAMNRYVDKSVNLFDLIKEKLGYFGACHFDWKVNDAVGSLGNAVFSKFEVNDYRVLTLKEATPVNIAFVESEKGFPTAPRHLVDAEFEVKDRLIHAISWHGAWTAPPADTRETLRQARLVKSHLEELESADIPYLVGCDLNLTPDKKTVGLISKIAKNLMLDSGVKQTTHPTVHKIAPKGFLIDYIFTSKHFKVKSLYVPQIVVSDHLPVVAELELI